ncbi:MAG: winged helix-turn-helix domain-containing protein [Terriglobia bacterium]|jgi:TolB-like protein|nr:winged helix-turn-helix domain-containing protein [Terriglobia bacterium]
MSNVVRFDPFEIDLDSGELRKRGIRIKLRDQSFQVLLTLLEHPGGVVTREELRQRLWRNDVFVDFDNNLNIVVARLREALGDPADHPRFIQTLPRRGYRFIAPVREVPAHPQETPLPSRTRVVVLPFINLSGDSAQDYFSDAMTDEIITALATLAPEQLAVIARTTAMLYKSSHKDVGQIGRELHVDHVVEGGVRTDGDHVAINVQLIQTSDQVHVFAKRYDIEMNQVFRLQSRIAADIARQIPSLSSKLGTGDPARKQPTSDLLAYQSYLRGRQHMYRETPLELIEARKCFEEAIARDAQFALAYDALGEAYFWTGFFGYIPPKEAFSAGLWAALRALEIDNTLAETHGLLGQFRQQLDYNWPEVQRELNRAMELNPSSPLVRFRYAGSGLLPQGRLTEGITHLEYALQLDPLSLLLRCWVSVFFWLAHEYDRALAAARFLVGLAPDYYLPQMMIGHICRDMGKLQEAITAQRLAVEWSGGAPQMLGWLGFSLALEGNTSEARSLLNRIHSLADQTYVSPTSFAVIHLGLGEIDETFLWMEQAIEDRDPIMIPIKSYPFLDPLRADPRFTGLLRKMNLES